MKLTKEQQEKVEENMGLVGKVIADKVHGTNEYRIYSYDDLYQYGCIGLCKAAATDKGGCFSTYAYRLIWNEICDALIYANRRMSRELLYDIEPDWEEKKESIHYPQEQLGVEEAFVLAKKEAVPCVKRGIDALIMIAQGYSCREIGEHYGVSAKLVTAWVSKARKYLKVRPEFSRA